MTYAFLGSFFAMGVAKAFLGNDSRAYEIIFWPLFLIAAGSLAGIVWKAVS